jgi:hypothetical protein
MMNQEELDPKEVQKVTPEQVESATEETVEAVEPNHEDQVRAVEAEDDHEEPKEQKLNIPDFDALNLDQSLTVIKDHIGQFPAHRIKGIVESGRSRMLRELNAQQAEAKEKYLAEGGNIIDFRYDQPLRKELGAVYGGYRDALRKHYSDLEAQLSSNLSIKLEIIDKIKALPTSEGSAKEKYDAFKAMREQWNNTGLVPKAEARNVWANFNHHVDNFFNFLRLAYDLIDKEYENNLAEKTAMIQELEAMAEEGASTELFRTLQKAHSRWKKIGPVPREQKDIIWDRFKAVTAKVHEQREQFNEILKAQNDAKIAAKRTVVEGIKALTEEIPTKHSGWQKASKALNQFREEFKKIGFVKSEENDAVWEEYKLVQREFNRLKNAFYKEEKIVHRENIEKKRALIELANSWKDSDDFGAAASALKKAQADWKQTGYVPKKEGDKLWEEFRGACNHFFDRMNGERKAREKKVSAAFKAKEAKLAEIKDANVASIEDAVSLSEEWGAMGAPNRKLDAQFDALLEDKLSGLGLEKSILERTLFEAKVKALVEADDQQGLMAQRSWIREETDRAKKELHQLENNIAFFGNAKGNPLLEAAQQNIENQKARVEELTTLRKLFNSLLK